MPVRKTGGVSGTIEPSELGRPVKPGDDSGCLAVASWSRPPRLERQPHGQPCQHGAHQIALRQH